jgi:polyisoprenoid-binding protein YceI
MMVIKKTFISLILIVLFMGFNIPVDAMLLQTDPTSSYIKFNAYPRIGSAVSGDFLAFTVLIKMSNSNVIDRIEAMIDTNSVFTDNSIRDRHLRVHFLDYKSHEYLKFVAEGPIKISDTKVKGFLTIKNISREIELPVEFKFLQSKSTGQLVLSSKIKNFQLNRREYNINSWGMLIEDMIDIDIELINRIYVNI